MEFAQFAGGGGEEAEPAEGMSGVADAEISWRADFPSGGGVESVRCIGR